MSGISTGCGLGLQFLGLNFSDAINSTVITAIQIPVVSQLTAGEAISDMTGWTTFLETSNYASSASDGAATIVRVTPFFTGDVSSASDTLMAGETAGFFLEIEDSNGNLQVFAGGSTTIPILAPTIAFNPTLAMITTETLAGSAVSSILSGGGLGTLTLSGPDSSLFAVDGDVLIVATEASAGNYSVNAEISNESGMESATFSLEVIDAVITATVLPDASVLHDGQAVSSMSNWSAFVDPANYSTNVEGETIASVAVSITGDATNAATVLAENQQVNIAITVTDSVGTERTFDLGQTTVQYSYTVNVSATNIATITINSIVNNAWPISITKAGAYAGTYSATAGALRSAPVNLAAPSISTDGDVQEGGGEVFVADDGFWIAEATTAFTYQWQRDGSDIAAGATGSSYVSVAADDGANITVEVTADDGVTQTAVSSAAVSVPAGAGGLSAVQLVPQSTFTNSTVSLDLSGAAQGDTIVLAVTCRDNANTFGFSSATFDGVDIAPAVAHSSPSSGGRHEVLFFTFARPANAVADFVIAHSEGIQYREIAAWSVVGAALTPNDIYAPATLPNGSGSYTGGTLGVVAGGVVLAAWAYDNNVGSGPYMTLAPASLQSGIVRDANYASTYFMGNAVETITATNAARTITADTNDADGVAFAAIALGAA